MGTETVRMSSKGQIVIPSGIREDLDVGEGSIFAVIGSKDSLILKKIEMPSKEQLIKDIENIAKEGRKRAKKLGIKESDVPNMVHETRRLGR